MAATTEVENVESMLILPHYVPPIMSNFRPFRGAAALFLQAIAENNCNQVAHILSEYRSRSCTQLSTPNVNEMVVMQPRINTPDENGSPPLHLAIRFGYLDMVRLLLGFGAEVNARGCPLMGSPAALHVAALYNRTQIAEELLRRGAIIDLVDSRGLTALHIAAIAGQTDVAKVLIDAGADGDQGDAEGRTPYFWATKCGNHAIASMLPIQRYDLMTEFIKQPWFKAAIFAMRNGKSKPKKGGKGKKGKKSGKGKKK